MENLAVIDTANDVATKKYVDDLDALDVKKTGDTMTGNLTVNKAGGTSYVFCTSTAGTAYYQARSAPGTQAGMQIVDHTSGQIRWIAGKTTASESGSNAGSDYAITQYSDSGGFLGTALLIARQSGLITVKGDPTDPLGVATKQFVENSAEVYVGTTEPESTKVLLWVKTP